MVRRTGIAFTVLVAVLTLATPALAGGWAVVTLDTLPREVQAGQPFQLGFLVRQHGKTPTNLDLNGKPLKPMVIAQKEGADTVRVEARQDGAVGHFVADMTIPSDGVWAWQIELPTFYVQNSTEGLEGNAAILAPLTVQPAAAASPPQPVETTLLGFSSATLRWSAALLLLLAAAIALYARQASVSRRHAARS